MEAIRFTDLQQREDTVALGLPAGRLGLAGAGSGTALALLHLPLPAALRALLATADLLGVAATVWLRLQELTVAEWALRALRLTWRLRLELGQGGWVDGDGG